MPFSKFKKSSYQIPGVFSKPKKQELISVPTPIEQINLSDIERSKFKLLEYCPKNLMDRQRQFQRSSLAIEYTPQFSLFQANEDLMKISLKEYPHQLLPWLIKKDPLFKANIVLGIYVTYLELVQLYGLFPLHPNMMRVSEDQQVAVWINKNFALNFPQQVLSNNQFTQKELLRKFAEIFKCCLPTKNQKWEFQHSEQMLQALIQLKKKQEVHRNCHEFIKYHTEKQTYSRNSMSNYASLSQTNISDLNLTPKPRKFSGSGPNTENTFFRRDSKQQKISISPQKRSMSISPMKSQNSRINRNKSVQKQRIHTKLNTVLHLQKDNTFSLTQGLRKGQSQLSISTSGDLYKKYLMFSSRKYQSLVRTQKSTQKNYIGSPKKKSHLDSNRTFIFKSNIQKLNGQCITSTILEGQESQRNTVFSPIKQQQIKQSDGFSPVHAKRKLSGGGESSLDENHQQKFFKSGQFKRRPKFEAKESFAFSKFSDLHSSPSKYKSLRGDSKQKEKLKSSFPYKTASTLTSFRFSNYTPKMIPSKSEESLPIAVQELPPQPKKIEELGVEEDENELDNIENDFNNIFSAANSNIKTEEEERDLQKMIEQFQEVLF